MKIIINTCYGGFSLSEAAYERLIELGIPVRNYKEQKRGDDGLYKLELANDEKVIFDRDLDENPDELAKSMRQSFGRYWELWGDDVVRIDPLVIQVVEELGEKANGSCASLRVIEIPDDIDWGIGEYDGIEHVTESHRTWF